MDRLWPVSVVAVAALGPLTLAAANQGLPMHISVLLMVVGVVGGIGLILGLVAGPRLASVTVAITWLFWNYPLFGDLWWITAFAVAGAVWIASQWEWVRSTTFLAAMAIVVVPVTSLAVSRPPEVRAASGDVPLAQPAVTPDVWVLVVDGYTSLAEVARQTGVDVSGFAAELEQRQFQVPSGRANYPVTYLSVASMLEQSYVAVVGDDTTHRTPYYRIIQGGNATVDQFLSWGYDYVHVPPGIWSGSECGGREDLCVEADLPNDTLTALAAMTPLSLDSDSNVGAAAAQSNPADVVSRVPDGSNPVFVFAHLMAPHQPFFYDRECEVQAVSIHVAANPQFDPDSYGQAIECLNRQLLTGVDAILDRDPGAVIVIQADHGTGDFADEFADDRYEVFSAIRSACPVPDQLSVVNVMRIVSGCLTGRTDLAEHVEYSMTYDDPVIRQLER